MDISTTMVKILRSPGWILFAFLVALQLVSYLFILKGVEVAWVLSFFVLTSIFWFRSNYAYLHLQRLRQKFYLHHSIILMLQIFCPAWYVYQFILKPQSMFIFIIICWPVHCVVGIVYTVLLNYKCNNESKYVDVSYSENLKSVSASLRWSYWGLTSIIGLVMLVFFYMGSLLDHREWILGIHFFLFLFLVSVYPNITFLLKKAWPNNLFKILGFCSILFMLLVLVLSISWICIYLNTKPSASVRYFFLRALYLNTSLFPIGCAYLLYMHNPMPNKLARRIAVATVLSGTFLLGLVVICLLWALDDNSSGPSELIMGIIATLVPANLLAFLYLQQVYIDHLFSKETS